MIELHKNWIKKFYNNGGMLLQEKYKGFLWFRKRYYFGWAQNAYNMCSCGFLIEADWFDTLNLERQLKIYTREWRSAYNRSLVDGGNPELVTR